MKRSLRDVAHSKDIDHGDIRSHIDVLRLVILNAIEQWSPRWFYVVLVQLTCRSLSWNIDNNNNNQEVAYRAAQWMTELLVPAQLKDTSLDIDEPVSNQQHQHHREIFHNLYNHTHRYLASVANESEPIYKDYAYETHGAITSCFWYPDLGARLDHIMLEFDDGVKLKIVADCRKWGDDAWFGFIREEVSSEQHHPYGRQYQEMLVGRRIRALRQVTAGPRHHWLQERQEEHSRKALISPHRSIERAIYVIQTTDGMQFPFVRCTQYASWSDGWITLKWQFPLRAGPVRAGVGLELPPSLYIVTSMYHGDIVAYVSGDGSVTPHFDHIFQYDGDDTSKHYMHCAWLYDDYFIGFSQDCMARDHTVCFASSLFMARGWRPLQAFLERMEARGLIKSVQVIAVMNYNHDACFENNNKNNENRDDYVAQVEAFKKRFDGELCRPVEVIDITGDAKLRKK